MEAVSPCHRLWMTSIEVTVRVLMYFIILGSMPGSVIAILPNFCSHYRYHLLINQLATIRYLITYCTTILLQFNNDNCYNCIVTTVYYIQKSNSVLAVGCQ